MPGTNASLIFGNVKQDDFNSQPLPALKEQAFTLNSPDGVKQNSM
jgi:hypothetical protein